MKLFNFDDVVNMDEYVGCKINEEYGLFFTQQVILKIFRHEFDLQKKSA